MASDFNMCHCFVMEAKSSRNGEPQISIGTRVRTVETCNRVEKSSGTHTLHLQRMAFSTNDIERCESLVPDSHPATRRSSNNSAN